MAGLFTALGTVAVFALVTGLVLLIINAIRKRPLRFWAFLVLGSLGVAIVSASVSAASKAIIPKDQEYQAPLTLNEAGDSDVVQPIGATNTPTPSLKPKLPTPIEKATPITTPTKEKYRSLTDK